jgi:type III secretion protein C
MKKFNLNRQRALLKCWLLLVACQSGSFVSKAHSFEESEFSSEISVPDQERKQQSRTLWKEKTRSSTTALSQEKPLESTSILPPDYLESLPSDKEIAWEPNRPLRYYDDIIKETSPRDSHSVQNERDSQQPFRYYDDLIKEAPQPPAQSSFEVHTAPGRISSEAVSYEFDGSPSHSHLLHSENASSESHPQSIPYYEFQQAESASETQNSRVSNPNKILSESSDLKGAKGKLRFIKHISTFKEQQVGDQTAEAEMTKQESVPPVVGFASPQIAENHPFNSIESTIGSDEPSHLTEEDNNYTPLQKSIYTTPRNAKFRTHAPAKKASSTSFFKNIAQTESEEALPEPILDPALEEEFLNASPETILEPPPATTSEGALTVPAEPLPPPPPATTTTEGIITPTRPATAPRAVETISPAPGAAAVPSSAVATPAAPALVPPQTATPPTPISPTPSAAPAPATVAAAPVLTEISVNFNNVAMTEFIRFMSRVTNKNFIFDEEDLLFNVTIISEEPTSIENLMAALLQELRIRDLLLIEQGNNIIIHRNLRVRAPGQIIGPNATVGADPEADIVTRVFRLNTLDPLKAAEIVRPLLSEDALIEVLRDSNNLIITDIVTNINKIAQLLGSLDAPNSGVTIGQYVARNAFVDTLVDLADRILQPIAQGNPFVLVPHPVTNSIYVVSNPFIVERALAILQNLDTNEGRTKILNLEALRLREIEEREALLPPGGLGTPGFPGGPGGVPPIGIPGMPGDPNLLGPEFVPGGISSGPRWIEELPAGHIERTLFFIHKLRFRKGDQIEIALRKIADSLQFTGNNNLDLIGAINSIQWLESSNSLIFTGTVSALEKVKELIEEIDVPLRQVFIETLILDTTIDDALDYGVDWATRFRGPSAAGAQAFLAGNSNPLVSAMDTVGFDANIGPDPSILARADGFHWGVVGRHLTYGGLKFSSIGALVTAIHNNTKANIIMNPKIITEDNNTAEIFVGQTSRYKTQSISNDQGSVITNNFQFLDVGTTLRITPLIGNNDIITMDILQEITNDAGTANLPFNSNAVDVNLVPVITKNKTVTRVHVPNGYFVVLSGMIRDDKIRTKDRIPCLGGIPLIGGVSQRKNNRDGKRNLMIFIRPLIVDTDEELEYITKRQQDVYREKNKFRRSWNYEIDEALDFLNIRPTDPDEIGCTIK